ncbi:MAG: alpha/beta hydrolase family protein [Micrococcales bacterium]|nr:alpha/beta hydrolase family protein [Micrococcales bacterium]
MKTRLLSHMAAATVPLLTLQVLLAVAAGARASAVADGPGTPSVRYSLAALADTDNGVDLLEDGSDQALRVRLWGRVEPGGSVVIVVGGVGHTAAEFDFDDGSPPTGRPMSLPQQARALRQAAVDQGLHPPAVIAFLGYDAPPNIVSAVDAGPIRTGAANLATLTAAVNQLEGDLQTTWVCHSYGSLVCASAMFTDRPEERPSQVVLIGSPGIHLDRADQAPPGITLYAGRGDHDSIGLTPALGLLHGSFGVDPSRPAFGAHPIPTDPGTGHSDYYRPGSTQLTAIATVAATPADEALSQDSESRR